MSAGNSPQGFHEHRPPRQVIGSLGIKFISALYFLSSRKVLRSPQIANGQWKPDSMTCPLWETNEDNRTVLASKCAGTPGREGTPEKSFTCSTHPWSLPLLLEDHVVRGQNKPHGTERCPLSLWISAVYLTAGYSRNVCNVIWLSEVFLWIFLGQEMKMELYKLHVSYLEGFALRSSYSSSNALNSGKLQTPRSLCPNRRQAGTSLGHS